MTDLRKAAEAVLERWDSPAWEWKKQGPTADLMANLRKALAAEPTKPSEDVEALRRDAERFRWLREKDGIAVDVTVFGSMEANLDAAIDAALRREDEK